MAKTIGQKELKTKYPHESGITDVATQTREGRIHNLVLFVLAQVGIAHRHLATLAFLILRPDLLYVARIIDYLGQMNK